MLTLPIKWGKEDEMRKYRLNKRKFADFVLGTLAMASLAGLLVWMTWEWVMAI